MSVPLNLFSISLTSEGFTPKSLAMASASSSVNHPRPFFLLLKLKNNFLCGLVVAILTIFQFFRTYSWISALIQCTAKDTNLTPISGLNFLIAFMRPTFPS